MHFNGFLTVAKETFPDMTERMESRFRAMEGLYNDWNAKINVISRKDIDSLYIRHILHSLAIAAYLKEVRPEVFGEWKVPAMSMSWTSGPEAASRAFLLRSCSPM